MRKRYTNKVYMREVTDFDWLLEENEELDCYIALKKINNMSEELFRYCNGKKFCNLGIGYSILEYVPRKQGKFYNCRVFIDNLNRIQGYYFDINNEVGIENNIPWFDDIYLDVTMVCPSITGSFNYIELGDEIELMDAYKRQEVTKEQVDRCYQVAEKLMDELSNGTNNIVIRGLHDFYRLTKNI